VCEKCSEKINYLEKFKPFVYKDEFIEMPYRLFIPESQKPGEKYPLGCFSSWGRRAWKR